MDEYHIRQKIKAHIESQIDEFLNSYFCMYKDNIGFMLFYHLLAVEKGFIDSYPNQGNFEVYRSAVSWFINRNITELKNIHLEFVFNSDDFNYYYNNLLPKIYKAYSDFKFLKEIMDLHSFVKSRLTEVNKGVYKLTSSTVWGGFIKEYLYYNGIHDEETMSHERELKRRPVLYIAEKINNSKEKKFNGEIKRINRLMIDINRDLLSLCYQNTKLDMDKIEGFKSEAINRDKNLLEFIASLYYFSQIQLEIFKLSLLEKPNYNSLLISFEKEYLIHKINKITNLNINYIEKCISYFTFDGRGTLLEFPLIEYNKKIYFVPSSFLLSDLQFTLTNGHYFKDVKVIRRDESVSKTIISEIKNSVKDFTNIVVVDEKYYEFIDERGEKENSDIDVALYDRNSNSLLVVECKWKDNHYISVLEENYVKILDTLNKAYKQLNKHQVFLEKNLDNVNMILGFKEYEKLDEYPRIFYITVDKRNQLYIDNKYLVPLYGLLTLFNIYNKSQQLELELVIDELLKQNTKVEYIYIEESQKEICIDDNITVYTDGLNLNYL